MGINDTVFGTPPQTTINQTGATRPPGYQWARGFFGSLPGVAQQPFPTYQGQLDPGLSPTMAMLLRNSQGYSQSGPPEILAGVQGSLGRFMNPSFQNPATRIPMGAPNFSGINPNQRIFGGQTAGGAGGAFGASGVASFTPKPFSGGSNIGTIGGSPPGMPFPPNMAKGGTMTTPGQGQPYPNWEGDLMSPSPEAAAEWERQLQDLRSGGVDIYGNPVRPLSGASPGGPSYGNDMSASPLPGTMIAPVDPNSPGGQFYRDALARRNGGNPTMIAPAIPGGGAVPNAFRNTFGNTGGAQSPLDPRHIRGIEGIGGSMQPGGEVSGPLPPPPPLPAWRQLADLGIGGQGNAAANQGMLAQIQAIPDWFKRVHAGSGITDPMQLNALWQQRLQRVGGPPPPAGGSGADVWTG